MSRGRKALQSKSTSKLRFVVGCCPNNINKVWLIGIKGEQPFSINRDDIPKAFNGWSPERYPEAYLNNEAWMHAVDTYVAT